MLELLSPAGSPEAVIAAVQNGADAVYMGFGDYNARRGAQEFFRGGICQGRALLPGPGLQGVCHPQHPCGRTGRWRTPWISPKASVHGRGRNTGAGHGPCLGAEAGCAGHPLHASTQMSIHNLEGVEAAAELGMTRAVLARELSLEQIKYHLRLLADRDRGLRSRRAVLLPLRPVLHERA
jgi:putative protease